MKRLLVILAVLVMLLGVLWLHNAVTAIQTKTLTISFSQVHKAGVDSTGRYVSTQWVAPHNVRIVGYQLDGYISAQEGFSPAYHPGLADYQAILSLSRDPAGQEGIVGFVQGTSRDTDTERDKWYTENMMFPAGYGVALDKGQAIYLLLYGRQDYSESPILFLGMATLYYVQLFPL